MLVPEALHIYMQAGGSFGTAVRHLILVVLLSKIFNIVSQWFKFATIKLRHTCAWMCSCNFQH